VKQQVVSSTSTTGNAMWPIRVEEDEEDDAGEDGATVSTQHVLKGRRAVLLTGRP
jgi:hypothetical protein